MAQQQGPPFQANPRASSGAPYSPWSGEVATSMFLSSQPTLPVPAPTSGQTANVIRDYEMQSTVKLSAPQSVSRTTPYTPIAPSHANPTSQNISVLQNYDTYVNSPPEVLYSVLGEYDRIISSRLSSFSTSLDRLTENLKVGHVTFASSTTKLDNHFIALDEKFNRLTQAVDMKLNGWTERLEVSVKTLVKETVAETLKNSWTDRDRYFNRMLGMLVENTKRTQDKYISLQNSLETIITSVDSLRSRQTALEDLMEALEKQGVCEKSSSSPSDVETYTNGLARLNLEFSKRAADTEELLNLLTNSINVVRNEAHAGRVQVANMIDKAHQIDKGQLKILQEDMRSLKSAVGIEDNPNDIGMEIISEGTEGRQIPPSLAGRIGYLERVIREELVLFHLMMGTRFNSPSNIASTTVSVSPSASLRVRCGLSDTTNETRYSTNPPHLNSSGYALVREEGESTHSNDPLTNGIGLNTTYEAHEEMQLHRLTPAEEVGLTTSPSSNVILNNSLTLASTQDGGLGEADPSGASAFGLPLPMRASLQKQGDEAVYMDQDEDEVSSLLEMYGLEEHTSANTKKTVGFSEYSQTSPPCLLKEKGSKGEGSSNVTEPTSIPGELPTLLNQARMVQNSDDLSEPLVDGGEVHSYPSDLNLASTLPTYEFAPSIENTEPVESINEQERLRLAHSKRKASLNDFYSDGYLSPLSPLPPSPPASEYTPSSTDSDSESGDDIYHELKERRPSSRPRAPYLLKPADVRPNAETTSPLPMDTSGLKIRLKLTKGNKSGKDAKGGGPRSVKKRKLMDGTEIPLAPKKKRGCTPKRKATSHTGKYSNSGGQVIESSDVVWPVMTNEDVDFNRQLIQCDICLNHYHFRCAGLLKGDRRVEVLEEPYNCPLCSFRAMSGMKLDNLAVSEGIQAHGGSCKRPDCDQFDNSELFVIEKILGRGLTKGEEGKFIEIWLVKWEGCSVASHSEWLPTTSIGNSKGLINDFYQQASLEGLNCTDGKTVILKEAFDDALRL